MFPVKRRTTIAAPPPRLVARARPFEKNVLSPHAADRFCNKEKKQMLDFANVRQLLLGVTQQMLELKTAHNRFRTRVWGLKNVNKCRWITVHFNYMTITISGQEQ